MSDLQKINILSKNKLDSLDTTQYPNQLFGTTDDTEDKAIVFAESERQKSKNLFNINAPRFVQGWHTSVSVNTITTAAGGDTTDDAVFELIPVKEGATYYIGANVSNQRLMFRIYDENKNIIQSAIPNWIYNVYWEGSYADFSSTNIKTHLTIPTGAKYLAFFTAWWSYEVTVSNLIISEYPDVDNYQPYNGASTHNGDAPVVFAESERQKSKNLFFVKTATVTSNGMTYSANAEAQTITLTGTTDYAYFRQPASGRVALEAGKTYTISADFTSTQGILTYVHFTDGTFETLTVVHGANQVPYVPDTPKEIMAIAIEMYGKTFNNDVLRVQVEEGSVATDWQYPCGAIVHEKDIEYLKQYPIQCSLRMLADQSNIAAYSNTVIAFVTKTNSTDTENLIKINDGIISFDERVKKVKLNAFVPFSVATTSNASINVYKNQAEILGYVACKQTLDKNQVCVFETPVIEIVPNDTISARAFCVSACDVLYWYARLNVEVWL